MKGILLHEVFPSDISDQGLRVFWHLSIVNKIHSFSSAYFSHFILSLHSNEFFVRSSSSLSEGKRAVLYCKICVCLFQLADKHC